MANKAATKNTDPIEKPIAAPQGTLRGPAVPVAEIVAIPVDEIEMGERLRPVDTNWAFRLGEIMLVEGQRTPIEVCRLPGQKGFTLVSGAHRLAAAQMQFDLSPIKAIVVSNDAIDRRLAEVSENLWRAELAPFDRAAFIADLVTAWKLKNGVDPAKDGRSVSANVRWQKQLQEEAKDTNDTVSFVYGWTEDIADKLGLSKRTIARDLLIYRRIPAQMIENFRKVDHPILRNATDLRKFAALESAEQAHVYSLMCHANMKVAGAPFDNVGAAIAASRDKPVPKPEAKRFATIISTLARMSAKEKTALVESPDFQKLLPKKAGDLLAPIRKGDDK